MSLRVSQGPAVALAFSARLTTQQPSAKVASEPLLLAVATADGHVELVDARATDALTSVGRLRGHVGGVNNVAFLPDAATLVSGGDDQTTRLWDLERQTAVRVFRGHTNYVMAVAASPRSHLVASGGFDETLRLWDVRAGTVAHVMPAHADPLTSIDFNRDGSGVASASYDGRARWWDVASGHCLTTLKADEAASPAAACVRFSPNGKFLLVATADSTVRLWHPLVEPSKCLKTFKGGHSATSRALTATFAPYRRRGPAVLVAGDDGHVSLYSIRTKALEQKVRVGGDAGAPTIVYGAEANPRRRDVIATVASDGFLRVHDLSATPTAK